MVDSYSSPMRAGAPSGSPTAYTDPKQIDLLLKSSSPEAVAASGRSYQKFASAHEKIAGELMNLRNDLHEAWGGKDAAAAQSALREIWASTTTVHRVANEFGVAIERHGSESLAWYKNNKPPSKDLAEARSWMTGANERISQAWTSLPQEVSTTLPPTGDYGSHGPSSAPGPTGGPSAGTSRGGAGAGGLSGHVPGISPGGTSSDIPGGEAPIPGPGGSGGQLAGLTPSGPGAGGPGNGFGTPLSGAGPLEGGSMSQPAGGSSVGLPTPGLGGPLTPGGIGTIPPGSSGSSQAGPPSGARTAAGAAAEEAQAAEPGAAARAGVVGPAVGAGAAPDEKEHTRSTWLTEDEDVWTGGIESTSQVIGGQAHQETVESSSETDLSDKLDGLTQLLNELGGAEPSEDPQTEIVELRARLEQLEQQASLGMASENNFEKSNLLFGDDQ